MYAILFSGGNDMRLYEVMQDKAEAIEYIQQCRYLIRTGAVDKTQYITNHVEVNIRRFHPLARVKISLTAVEAKIEAIKETINQLWRDEDMAHAYDNMREYIELREDILRILK
jgi:hypothetical protein